MKKQIILSAVLLLLLGSCAQPSQTNDSKAIDIAGCIEQLTELKVSQLGKNIRYVPLETTDSSLIGNSYSIKLLKDKILVTTGSRCLAFDKQTGKYLCSIGHRGNDPEGYSNAMYYVHPQTGTLYFHRQPNKLLKYSQEGTFLGEVTLPKNLTQGFCATFTDSLIIGHYGEAIGIPSSNNKLVWFNEKGEAKDSINNSNPYAEQTITPNDIASIAVFKEKTGKKAFGMLGYNGVIILESKNGKKYYMPVNYPTVWNSGNDIHFREALKDTIFTIKGNEMQPYLTFNIGKWTLPTDKIGDKEGTEEYITVSYVMETPQNILFQCIQGIYSRNIPFTGIYDKTTGKTYMNKNEAGLTDDLSRFMPFFPETHSEQGEYASLQEVGDIQKWLDEHPETAQEGKLSFLKDINEDSNPVCIIVEP